MSKIKIAASVRIDSDGYLTLFYYDEHNILTCYTRHEGHSEASVEYMRSLQLASDDEAKAMVEHYNKLGDADDGVEFYPVKRLHSNRRYRWDIVSV